VPVVLRSRKPPYDAEKARQHIARRDPVMRGIVKACGPYGLRLRGTPYQSLMRALLYQQLAGAAAAAIERRFLALYGGRAPEPHELLATRPEDLRAAGLSRQKSSYLYSLAEHFGRGHLPNRRLMRLDDERVIAEVTVIKGIGRWTADMLLLFCLGRPDVLPVGDFGVRKSMMLAYGLKELPDPKTMERIGEPWRPYRSAAAWYLWRNLDMQTL
jgi:3-methyladenine DNA glycosylase/8-oxoguanine DNA glycosylase